MSDGRRKENHFVPQGLSSKVNMTFPAEILLWDSEVHDVGDFQLTQLTNLSQPLGI